MKNKYDEIREKHQKRVNSFPLMFAFSDRQFKEGMENLGLKETDTDKIISIGGGGFIRKSDLDEYNKMWDEIRNEHNELITADKTGDGYIKDMFVSELENHEYCYTYDLEDTFNALEITYEQVASNSALMTGLQLAKQEVLGKTKNKGYENEL